MRAAVIGMRYLIHQCQEVDISTIISMWIEEYNHRFFSTCFIHVPTFELSSLTVTLIHN